jgi:hypothetical protein
MRALMTTASIGRILDSYLGDMQGQPGFWRGLREEVPVYVFSDDSHDRMRVMAPVGELRELGPEMLHILLQANYDRALDARYAMRGMELWSVAVHPLATLAPDDFATLIDQVVRLVKNTGSTYASTDLVFMAPRDGDEAEGESADGDDASEGGDPAGDEEPNT